MLICDVECLAALSKAYISKYWIVCLFEALSICSITVHAAHLLKS